MVSGAALQMQRELQWFEEVKKFALDRNCKTKSKRPIMVFKREHKELRKEGKEWMKKTADSYTITSALIVTIVFAAAITVPGGNDGNTWKAIYATKLGFIIFVVSDAISLFTSTTSLLLCLSIGIRAGFEPMEEHSRRNCNTVLLEGNCKGIGVTSVT